ncbi:hypothetical protein HII36_25555 [Nonomuraea sp. NN258]|uniref:PEP-utilizing enzyme n=1 Tax=Nonomuraea antri TaxID=2730852 RepID=UPI001568BF88|nr:PEP-utilizing enzyme [Nonomuraea antri]NRQ35166.1 hypothetical protein [Nonomuraea antri]
MSIDQGQELGQNDFPVVWSEPGDEALQWRFFTQSFPNQVPPLEFDVLVRRIMSGADYAFTELKGSFQETLARRVNTYVYRAMGPARPDAPEDPAGAAALRALRAGVDDLARAWAEDYLPQLQAFLDDFSGIDVTGLSDAELVSLYDRATDRLTRLWELHFMILFPAAAAVNEYDRTYRELFGEEDPLAPYRLLSGLPNKTVEAGRELWRLSRVAGGVPEVRAVLESAPAEQVVAALERIEAAKGFLDELRAFLNRYGQRGDMCSLTAESWVENPVGVVRNLSVYLRRPDSASPEHTQGVAAAERELAVAEARERLAGYPRPVAELFEQLLAAAQAGSVLTEDHTFYIDYGGVYQIRRIILEMGGRLVAAGALDEVADVFLLGSGDLRAALTARDGLDARAVAAGNAAEMRRFAGITPEPVIGSDAPPQITPAFMVFMGSLAGMAAPPPWMAVAAEPGTLRGTAGAAGVVRGIARIVHTLEESGRLGPGEILVAPTTAPPWTPLFAIAGGVITDTGGVLSHCAVVAREYGVPTVVGAAGATQTIKDGQLVELDGGTGIVRLLEET